MQITEQMYADAIKIYEASFFARDCHEGQFRKYTGLPYITHPMRVAAIVQEMPISTCRPANCYKAEMIQAAWLHDTVEDCGITCEMISARFGERVADMVFDMTNPSKIYPELSRRERKELDRKHLADVPWEVKIIKLADRLDNLLDLNHPKAPDDFKKLYAKESKLLLEVIAPAIYNDAEATIKEFEKALAALEKS